MRSRVRGKCKGPNSVAPEKTSNDAARCAHSILRDRDLPNITHTVFVNRPLGPGPAFPPNLPVMNMSATPISVIQNHNAIHMT